jgi:hypothetical protein
MYLPFLCLAKLSLTWLHFSHHNLQPEGKDNITLWLNLWKNRKYYISSAFREWWPRELKFNVCQEKYNDITDQQTRKLNVFAKGQISWQVPKGYSYRLLCLGWNILTLSRTYLTTREHLSERVIILTSNTQVLISINRNVGYECKKKEFEDTKEVISTRILKMDSKYNFFVKRNVK